VLAMKTGIDYTPPPDWAGGSETGWEGQ
jgi:hypothetical protein